MEGLEGVGGDRAGRDGVGGDRLRRGTGRGGRFAPVQVATETRRFRRPDRSFVGGKEAPSFGGGKINPARQRRVLYVSAARVDVKV